MFKPTKDFPLLERYKAKFAINENTIFAYDGVIYTNYELPEHSIIHEQTHLKQQKKIGLDKWVDSYLGDNDFRLKVEIDAYKNQLRSVKDRNQRNLLKISCARDLSSTLYDNITSYENAFEYLKV
jgi:hypothetical protein